MHKSAKVKDNHLNLGYNVNDFKVGTKIALKF